jgi:hypothetical protein
MANNMIICGRYGNSCGTPFIKDDYIKEHRQYEIFGPYLKDRPSQEWTELSASTASSDDDSDAKSNEHDGGGHRRQKFRLTRRSKNKRHKTRKNHASK